MTKANHDFEARVEALLGGHGATARLARALGKHASGLHRIWAGKRPLPEDLKAVIELLEKVDPKDWPARWQ
jgi:hypothetical protein